MEVHSGIHIDKEPHPLGGKKIRHQMQMTREWRNGIVGDVNRQYKLALVHWCDIPTCSWVRMDDLEEVR